MPVVQFAPFSSLIQPPFWHKLSDLKIDVLRLSDDAIPIYGSYSSGRSVTDRETGKAVALPCNLTIGSESFQMDFKAPTGSIPTPGIFKNYNTIEDFKSADKPALFEKEASKIWDRILQSHDTHLLNHFILITFADLKRYKYYYWFAFPAFVSKPAWEISEDNWKNVNEEFSEEALVSIHEQWSAHLSRLPYFLVKYDLKGTSIAPVESYPDFFASTADSSCAIAFVDPSALPSNPGWPLRNLLAYLRALYPESTSTLRVICWRDADTPTTSTWKSRFGVLHTSGIVTTDAQQQPSAVGWEKNQQGKLGPRVADLAPMMDPARLADQAVDLNLKLMRWRILPSLDLEKISNTKCLLLGAGTLGCYVARNLMGWGVRTITIIDSARVSFSNPVRQPLFEFEDCLGGGKPKAECAAGRLKKISPRVNAVGHMLSIPMPGHPIPASSIEQTKKDVEKLEALISEHDAIFLLMDSRESRWLPTVIGAAKQKIVINAALGFDTFLVMRHGARATDKIDLSEDTAQLGCYFCNDIVAPSDSLTDRTLDQMCTVTRPGLAAIASSTAVELLATLLQHPDGVRAAAPPPNQDPKNSVLSEEKNGKESVLGLVPHQLRGFLAQFRIMHIVGAAYHRCTGCSETVLQAYEKEGFEMMLKAFNDAKYLPALTKLEELYAEGEAVLENVDWDVEDDEIPDL